VSQPKVFQPGALTLAVVNDAVTVAVGNGDVDFIRSMTVEWDAEAKRVRAVVEFYHSHHEGTKLMIEEAMRRVRSLGWIEVR
jgi:hypothetical protein